MARGPDQEDQGVRVLERGNSRELIGEAHALELVGNALTPRIAGGSDRSHDRPGGSYHPPLQRDDAVRASTIASSSPATAVAWSAEEGHGTRRASAS